MVKLIIILIGIYIILCALLYLFQEKLIFFPEKLNKDFIFKFDGKFEELHFTTQDHILLSGILFHSDSSKGLIFYLHGNAGSISTWGEITGTYTNLHYDVLMIDYRGYGKSEGRIESQHQLYQDLQMVYDSLKNKYDENNIIVLGYSIGTGPAAKIASSNHPKLLILQAPYFSLTDLMRHTYPIIPTFILKYKFETNKFIKDCKMPIVIFHGDQDNVIYYNSSVKLHQQIKSTDTFITLKGQGHNEMTYNPEYQSAIRKILGN